MPANDINKPVLLSNEDAIQLVRQFLPKEWKHLKSSEVDIKRMQCGFSNQVYICSIDKANKEPNKLIIRMYGGNMIDNEMKNTLMKLTINQELVLLGELGHRGLAPKVYGIFEEGRIEEFIGHHMMTEEEACTPEIQRDMAKTIARFHSVDNVPLPKPGYA